MSLAGPIFHSSIQYVDFVEIFNVSLAVFIICFAHFSGCRVSFVYSCYLVLECYNVFLESSRVQDYFVLFI